MRANSATLKTLTMVATLFPSTLLGSVALAQAEPSTPAQATPAQGQQTTSVQQGVRQGLSQRLARLEARVQKTPTDLAAWIDLGNVQLSMADFKGAKQSFLEATTQDYLSVDAHFGLGLAEYSLANYQAALFEFGEVTRLYPDRFDGHFNRAITLAQLGDHTNAVAAFQEALAQANPEAGRQVRANAQVGLAAQLEALGQYSEAADAYAAAIRLSASTPELLLAQGQALYQANRGLEALPDLTRLAEDQQNVEATALIARIYLKANQTSYALDILNRAIVRAERQGNTDGQASLLLQLGLVQRSLGRNGDASASFAQATKLAPQSSQAFYNLGVSYLEAGRAEDALAPLRSALALERQKGKVSGETMLALASAFDELGRANEAYDMAQQAAQRASSEAARLDAVSIAGRAQYRAGNFRGALASLREVARARQNNADAQLWAGLAFYQLGDYAEATTFFERAAGLEPNNVDARLNLGAAYLASERYVDAENVYTLITYQNEQDAEAFYNLGWALFSQGRRDEAERAWTSASELDYAPATQALGDYFGSAQSGASDNAGN